MFNIFAPLKLGKPELRKITLRKRETRILKLLGLTAFNMVLNAFTYSLAGSLFLSRIGPEKLPFAFILLGSLSIPGYALFYPVVDRLDRPQLFRYLLWIIIGLTLIARLFINLETEIVYYVIFIGFYFQWTLLIDIMLPSLVSDYCTTLDWKRYAHWLGMAQAAGGIVGGGLVGILSRQLQVDNLLLAVPVCAGITIAQLTYLERSEKPIETRNRDRQSNSPNSHQGQVQFLATLPKLLQEYPIILFISLSIFLAVILRMLSEFQYFTAYFNQFSDEQTLTQFLGWLNSINSILQFLILYYWIRPLLNSLGVNGMNLVYPFTTLLSFVGLGIRFSLPTAIILNLNNIGLDQSLNDSVRNLNYNAIPHKVAGEVRTLCEGLFYSLGLITAGLLLWFAESNLELQQITLIGIVISLLSLGIRYFLGKEYLNSLLTLLRSGSVSFNEVSEGLSRLPDDSIAQIYQLLKGDIHDQALGLELAARLQRPQQVLAEIEPLLYSSNAAIHQGLVQFFSYSHHADLTRYLGSQLVSDHEVPQLIALEALIASQQTLTDIELRRLLRSTTVRSLQTITRFDRSNLQSPTLQSRLQVNSTIQALVCVAAQVADSRDPEIQTACQHIWETGFDPPIQLAVIRGIRSAGNHQLIPLLEKVLSNATAEVKREGFTALAELAHAGDTTLAQLAAQELANSDPLVRAAVLKLLEVVKRVDLLPQIAQYLEHENLSVRLQSAFTLAAYGERSLNLVKPYLFSPRLEVVEAAITTLGKLGTRQAEDVLFKALQPHYQTLAQTQDWLQKIPQPAKVWRMLEVAIKDYQGRLVQRVLQTLSSLDNQGTFTSVRQFLSRKDPRARANAIEALASGPHRRFVLPVISLLESPERLNANHSNSQPLSLTQLSDTTGIQMIEETLKFTDRWIQIGALIAAKYHPKFHYLSQQTLLDSLSDSFAQALAAQLFTPGSSSVLPDDAGEVGASRNLDQPNPGQTLIDRILFLKGIPFLEHLFLDEILLVYQSLKILKFASGEPICVAGSPLSQLHILYQGIAVTLIPQSSRSSEAKPEAKPEANTLRKLFPGDYFGESGLLQEVLVPETLIAAKACVVMVLSRDVFEPLIDRCPRLLMGFNL